MDTVAGLLAETEWHEAEGMPYGGTFTGAEAILANVLGPISQDVEGFIAHAEEVLDAGDEKAVSLGRYGGQAAEGAVDVRSLMSGPSETAKSCVSFSTQIRSSSARPSANNGRSMNPLL